LIGTIIYTVQYNKNLENRLVQTYIATLKSDVTTLQSDTKKFEMDTNKEIEHLRTLAANLITSITALNKLLPSFANDAAGTAV
jgi:hypothetical protein